MRRFRAWVRASPSRFRACFTAAFAVSAGLCIFGFAVPWVGPIGWTTTALSWGFVVAGMRALNTRA